MENNNSFNKGFWEKLPKPFLVLAPMSNITDAALRLIVARHGKPHVIYTEFVSVDGLCSRGRKRLLPDMFFHEDERPVVVQFFGKNPEHFFKSAVLAKELGFDGVDINLGCPDKDIINQGAGAGLIKNPPLAREIIQATREGAAGLPISVKTRLGYYENEIESWIPELLKEKPVALALHGRTKKQKYQGYSDWQAIKRAAEIVKQTDTLFIGNGDILSYDQGIQLAEESGSDGIMIGRAVVGDPWVFNPDINKEDLTLPEIFDVMLEHARLHADIFDGVKNYVSIRKHLKSYVSDFPGAKHLRVKLVQVSSKEDVEEILNNYSPDSIEIPD